MSAAKALDYLRAKGVIAELDGDNILLTNADDLPDAHMNRLRELKPGIIALLRAETAAPVSAVSAEDTRASVDRLIADMAAENERRRDWHKQPLDDWRAGYIKICSALTGETTIIRFHTRGRA
jgi:hypothetical protein